MTRTRQPGLPWIASVFAATGVALLALSACKPKPPVPMVRGPDGEAMEAPPPVNDEDERAATVLETEADQLAAAGDEAGARKKRDLLVELYPGTQAGAATLLARAKAARQAAQIQSAVELYERVLFYRPTVDRADTIRETYAELLLEIGRTEDAAKMLWALYKGAPAPRDKQRLGLTLAKTLDQKGQEGDALTVLVEIHELGLLSVPERTDLEQRATRLAVSGLSFKEAQALWDDVQDKDAWRFVLPALGFKLAKVHYHVRNYDRSEAVLQLVAQRYPTTSFGKRARDFLGRLKARFKVQPRTVGVLLPLSGRFQQYGARSQAAIELALGERSTIELVFKDTAGNPTVAAKAVEDLVLDNHVVAIIGPMFSDEALAAALKAEELSVPIISLSYRKGLPEIGSWVFRTALTVKAQAVALADVAFNELNMSRFALLYPRNRYGKEFINAFWDEVDARKGEIRAAESYEYDQKTFQEPVRKLVGRYFRTSRWEYHKAVRDIYAKNLPPHRIKMLLEKVEKSLPPVIDFDAIVIPDSGRTIGLIAPAIAVEDIVLTRDPKMLDRIKKAMGREDVKPTTLLGASTWNTPQTVDYCERYCENSVFVDAYYPDSPAPKVRDFVAAFRQKMETDPSLWEAQAFDTAGLVKWIIEADKPRNRTKLRDNLLRVKGFDGVTGKLRFDKTGEVKKKLLTLTIEDRTIRLWSGFEELPEG